jgi:hypothetical protein
VTPPVPGGVEKRPRVVVAVTYGLAVRYLVSTGLLDELSRHCEPVVALGWEDPELVQALEQHHVDVRRLPPARIDYSFRQLERRLGVAHERLLRSPTTRLRRARRERTRPARTRTIRRVRRTADQLALRWPGAAARLAATESTRVQAETNVADFTAFLSEVGAEAVVSLMPYHDQDGLLIWAARFAGIPTVGSVISFDNPTIHGRLRSCPDVLLVWNRDNADQLVRSHPDLEADRVRVVGAPQFDLHRRPELVLADDEWRRRLGLPADRPVILYGAGPARLTGDESPMAELIDAAIDDGRIPGRPFLLVRRHPVDPPGTWGGVAERLRHGTVVDAWAPESEPMKGWPTSDDIVVQMSSLAHAAVHVNICSSMTIDGAMFDRPQICPVFLPGAEPGLLRVYRNFARQEHWRPIEESGGLARATDPASLIGEISSALEDPARRSDGRRRMIEAVLTYDDGRSCERWIDEVERVVGVAPRSTTLEPSGSGDAGA